MSSTSRRETLQIILQLLAGLGGGAIRGWQGAKDRQLKKRNLDLREQSLDLRKRSTDSLIDYRQALTEKAKRGGGSGRSGMGIDQFLLRELAKENPQGAAKSLLGQELGPPPEAGASSGSELLDWVNQDAVQEQQSRYEAGQAFNNLYQRWQQMHAQTPQGLGGAQAPPAQTPPAQTPQGLGGAQAPPAQTPQGLGGAQGAPVGDINQGPTTTDFDRQGLQSANQAMRIALDPRAPITDQAKAWMTLSRMLPGVDVPQHIQDMLRGSMGPQLPQ